VTGQRSVHEMIRYLLLILLVLISGCSASSSRKPASIDERLIGLTVEEAIHSIQLRLGEYFILDEPPGIARAVTGYTKNSEQIELYFKRGDVPFNMKMDWKLKDVVHLKVVAIAHKNPNFGMDTAISP